MTASINWITLFDLFGVFVFAISGGFDAVRYKLDILGIAVLAIATGVGGGMLRDIMLGIHPPSVFVNQTYLFVCLCAALVVIFFSHRVERHFTWVRYADAIGLGVFAAIGAAKAVEYGLGWVGVLMISAITATGGGVIRDLLVREIPMILRADFYASAALIGGGVYLIALEATAFFALPEQTPLILSACTAIAARFFAMHLALSLPGARRKQP